MRQQVRFVGRVQGVGFRATARRVAGRHAVSGWVRNEPDGSVLLEVQGDADAVAAFRAELDDLVGALVRHRDVLDLPAVDGESGFVIDR